MPHPADMPAICSENPTSDPDYFHALEEVDRLATELRAAVGRLAEHDLSRIDTQHARALIEDSLESLG